MGVAEKAIPNIAGNVLKPVMLPSTIPALLVSPQTMRGETGNPLPLYVTCDHIPTPIAAGQSGKKQSCPHIHKPYYDY